MGTWCWYGIRMDLVSIVLMISATVLCVVYKEKEDPILLAMVFSYILQLQGYLINMLYFMGDLEKNMVSVIRCYKLLDIPQERLESKLKIPIDTEKQWPTNGNVTFNDVYLRYRPNTEQVLKGLSFNIEGGQKIGIVGRTGAGKSTISLGLSRIVEIESGSI